MICSVYGQHYTDDPGVSTVPGVSTAPGVSTDPGVSTAPGVSTDPGQTDKPQSSSNTVLVAGVAVTAFVLALAAFCIVVLVVWWR